MVKVGLVGALGYAGRELMRLLVPHPEAELVAAVEPEAGQPLAEALPAFRGLVDLVLEPFDAKALAEKCDVVFMAVPGVVSMGLGKALFEAGVDWPW